MSMHNPEKAQKKLERALDLASASRLPLGGGINKYSDDDDGSKEMEANIVLSQGIDYTSVRHRSYDSDRESRRMSNVDTKAKSRSYSASISAGEGKVYAQASVERGGTYRPFNDNNREKAAALITSLAAKRLGARATKHADELIEEVTAAREAFKSE